MAPPLASAPQSGIVAETRFGLWFLNSRTWVDSVLRVAIRDLRRLLPEGRPPGVMLDVGCGHGHSFALLSEAFAPRSLIGLDYHDAVLANAVLRARNADVPVTLVKGECAKLPFATESIDAIFCHQTFHHLREQECVLAEFHRVLRPDGHLLLAESTRAYIDSWIIRLLFRHPMEVQRGAEEYLTMLRSSGFVINPLRISYPYLWWSRPDLGILERLGIAPPLPGHRVETLVNVVARRG